MKPFGIRERMLLAALLPVTLVAILLSGVLLVGRVGDINDAHFQRARSLARQVAIASEFGIFSINTKSLQTIAAGYLQEIDVVSVVIQDANGLLMAKAGMQAYSIPSELVSSESHWLDESTGNEIWVQPVVATQIVLDDFFESDSNTARPVQILGHVLIEISRKDVILHERQMLLAGISATMGGLLLGGFLAVRIGQSVIRPIFRVSDMVVRIGRGELSARIDVQTNDPLGDLQSVLNQMASRLERGRDELEQRILEATQELRLKKEEAETATQAKSVFLAAASHDLRQPIHALGLFVYRLAQLPHDEKTHSIIGFLQLSLKALQDLLDALMDISRFDSNTVAVNVQAFPIENLLEQLRTGLEPTALANNLDFRVRPSSHWVMSDPALLYRVLINLTSNALTYTKRGGVVVTCRLRNGCRSLRIEVWDSGIGIAQEYWQDIYKEFFQIDNLERDRHKGQGLGLSIVDRIVKLLGYQLSMISKPGCGTRFSMDVPLTSPLALNQAAPELTDMSMPSLSGLRVLVIEDDLLVANGLTSLLKSWHMEVRLADRYEESLTMVEQGFVPDALLCDYRLRGGLNGLETIQGLRLAMRTQVPACLISGDTDPEIVKAAQLTGLTLLHKPVRIDALRSVLISLTREPVKPNGTTD